MIAAGARHTCALRLDGTVACWGSGDEYATGSIDAGADRSRPTGIPELSDVAEIASGTAHSCALLSSGRVWCWGGNNDSQLGNGTKTSAEAKPVRAEGITDAIAIAAGDEHSCALMAEGTVACWGENRDHELNDGSTIDRRSPVDVQGLRTAVAISAGTGFSCALRSDRTVRCWGRNDFGQLGDGTSERRIGPVEVAGLTNVVGIDAGGGHACAVLADGTVSCWGRNVSGQLGRGATSPFEPRAASVTSVAGADDLSAGGDHTCAVLGDGRVLCWGYDNAGQLGANLPFSMEMQERAHPTPLIVFGIGTATAISASPYAHTCALLENGRAMCWGINDYGELGDGLSIGQAEARVPIEVVDFDVND